MDKKASLTADGDLERVHRALELAQKAGSPVARSDTGFAEKTLRRLRSRHRRRWHGRTPHRQAMIEDLAHGYAQWSGGKQVIGPLMIDFRWLAALICDTVFFIPPAGSSGFTTEPNDDQTNQLGRSRLFEAARTAGLTPAKESYGTNNRSFSSYRLSGRGPLCNSYSKPEDS